VIDEVLSLAAVHTGPISNVRSVNAGYRADQKAIVTANRGQFFVKAFEESDPATSDPQEVAVYPLLGKVAPPLVAYERSSDWMVLVYAFADGSHCDLRLGSADVPKVVAVVDAVGGIELPEALQRFPAPWKREASTDEVAALGGSSLLHSDLQPENILVAESAVLVDWTAPRSGSPVINLTELVTQLIAAGHTPEAAEAQVVDCEGWPRNAATIDMAAAVLVRMHRGWEREAPGWAMRYREGSWLRGISGAVETWAEHRNVAS
jgi:hypothetical protein